MQRTIRKLFRSLFYSRYLVVISICIFILIFIPTSLLHLNHYYELRNSSLQSFNRQQLYLAQQASLRIEESLTVLSDDVTSVLRIYRNLNSVQAKERMLSDILKRSESRGVTEVGMLSADGLIIHSYCLPGEKPIDTDKVLAEYQRVGPGQILFSPSVASESAAGTNRVKSLIVTPIAVGTDSLGLLYLNVDISSLVSEAVSELQSARSGYAWVIDNNGIFLYHPNPSFTGRNASLVRHSAKPGFDFSQIDSIIQNRMIPGQQGFDKYTTAWHHRLDEKTENLIAYYPVSHESMLRKTIWSVAVVAPAREVMTYQLWKLIRLIAADAILAVGMFVIGLVAAIYLRRKSRSLEEEIKLTQADLFETEQVYQRIVDQSSDLIYILDMNMCVVLLNRYAVDVFARLVIRECEGGTVPDNARLNDAKTYVGHRLDEIFRAEDWAFVQRKMKKVLRDNNPVSYEHSVETIRGRKVRLSTELTPIRDDQGTVIHILGTSRDVTEKMEFEQRMYHADKLASVGTLAAGVAHEINNPLAIILGFTDLLIEKCEPGTSEYEDLKMIEYNGNIAKKVVENLLGFARISEIRQDHLDIVESIKVVINILRHSLQQRNIELKLDIAENIPAAKGDAREFQQVILNLLNNSMAAVQPENGEIGLSSWEKNNIVYVTVSDNGSGISDKDKLRIFDPFFSTKKEGEGTGLGLWICYGIIRKYDGEIKFESSHAADHPDKPHGSKFTILLPVHTFEEGSNGS